MSSMSVPLKPDAAVPAALDGTRAVGMGLRIKWRLIQMLISVLYAFFIAFLFPLMLAQGSMSPTAYTAILIVLTLAFVAWVIADFVFLLKEGATVLMKATGVRWVNAETGLPARGAGLGKLVLQSLIGSVTAGLGTIIICFVSMDECNRTWFDRTLNIQPIDTKKGRDPYRTAPPIPAPAPPPSVQPWNATASAAASLPFVPEPPSDEEPGIVPPIPTRVAVPAPQPASSDYIVETPWTSDSAVSSASMGPAPVHDPTPRAPASTVAPSPFTPPVDTASVAPSPTVAPGGDAAPVVVPPVITAPFVEDEDDVDKTQLGTRATRLRITLDTGSDILIETTVLIGRNPVATAAHPHAALVPIEDPGRTVSKTHMALIPAPGGVLVDDLHSTGGTSVISSNGSIHDAIPSTPVLARPGDRIRFGDRSAEVSE